MPEFLFANEREPEVRARVLAAIEARRLRTRRFGEAMFGEPAWDMLLALFASDEGIPVSKLANISRTPATTALRWLAYLEAQRLVFRKASATDQRVQFIEISETGREAIEHYFRDVEIRVTG